MAKSKYKHRKASSPARAAILDAFTAHDLEVWATRSTDVQGYYDRVYYDSRIEVIGDMPPGASCTVLDKVHLCLGGRPGISD